jgi:hypothetical protein
MRIIGYIEHPEWKITVFKMDHKISVQFEHPLYIQTFKFTNHPDITSLEGAKTFVNQSLLQGISENFKQMHLSAIQACQVFRPTDSEYFDEII